MGFLTVVVTLLVFTLIVVVHEYGHFIVAKKNGILVEEFAVGMGPLIFGHKKGDTLYSLRLFPIGGFCKMLGEEAADPEKGLDERSFAAKKVWQRIAVCIAGVVMNFLLAVVLLTIVASFENFSVPEVAVVEPDSPAESAGLLPGDYILGINGNNISVFDDIRMAVNLGGGEAVTVKYRRNGEVFTAEVKPAWREDEATGAGAYIMGISAAYIAGPFAPYSELAVRNASLPEIVKRGIGESVFCVKLAVEGLRQLFSFKANIQDFAGPIGVGQIVGANLNETVNNGERAFVDSLMFALWLAGFLSANLAVLNLLPIPALDGGRIVFLLIEGIRKKPMDPEKEGWIQLASFVLVIGFALVIAFNDVIRLL